MRPIALLLALTAAATATASDIDEAAIRKGVAALGPQATVERIREKGDGKRGTEVVNQAHSAVGLAVDDPPAG